MRQPIGVLNIDVGPDFPIRRCSLTDSEHGQKPGKAKQGLSRVIQRMNDDYRNEVVKRALDWRSSVSPAARAALNNAANAFVEVDGFRNAGLAMTPLLIKPMAERSAIIDSLAGAVLRVWAESQAALCELVTAHLARESLLADAPDYSANTIRTRQHDRRWDDAIDRLTELRPDESRDDLLLASYYVSGLLPAAGAADAGPPDSDEFAGALGEALDFLRSLPPDSPEWEQTVVGFVDAIGGIKEAKLAEVQEVADLDAEVAGISRQYASLLEYFEWDLEKRLAARPRPWADIRIASQVVKELAGLLGEYAPVHPMAAIRSEEARRGPRRAELEERIDGVLAQFEALPVRTAPTTRVEEPPDLPAAATRPEQQPVVSPAISPVFSEEELASLRAENERLSAENLSIESHNESLIAQAGELESDVNENRNLAEMWRRSYQDLLKSQEMVAVDALPEFENVAHVVRWAEERLADRLSFLLNSRSDTQIPFDNPRQVWDALEWLATTYYQAKTGKNGSSDFDLSLRQTCGWRYTPDQSNTTVGQYRDYYETRVGHRRRALREHIGTGNGYHRGTIRIAFAWDADEQKVVVGYVGRHQRTDAS